MKIKLLFAWTALALLFTACEEEGRVYTLPDNGPYEVKIYAGMPGVYGYTDGGSDFNEPQADVNIKIYRTQEDYLLNQNVILEGLTNTEGLFTFESDTAGTYWFSAHKDTLSNIRGVTNINEYSGIRHNEIIIPERDSKSYGTYHGIFATLTNTPTRLQLTVSHQGQIIEGADVQLYFTKQNYLGSLPAQRDFEHLRPTYGYPRAEASDPEGAFTYYIEDSFLQTTDEEGIVVFDNLEPRNYWFRITKDTLSNEDGIIHTREALPRNADITTIMTIGVE